VAEHAGPDAEEGHREALRATVRHESIRHTAVFTVGSSSSAITISETSPGTWCAVSWCRMSASTKPPRGRRQDERPARRLPFGGTRQPWRPGAVGDLLLPDEHLRGCSARSTSCAMLCRSASSKSKAALSASTARSTVSGVGSGSASAPVAVAHEAGSWAMRSARSPATSATAAWSPVPGKRRWQHGHLRWCGRSIRPPAGRSYWHGGDERHADTSVSCARGPCTWWSGGRGRTALLTV
jgi:hypothetical protein